MMIELVCQIEGIPWIFGHARTEALFRITVVVYIGGVKIIDSVFLCPVNDLMGFFIVDL